MNPSRRHAFTLVELLVVIAIIGVLIAMMLPAIQASRETANRTCCMGNLTQMSSALQNYEMAHLAYPPGTIEPKGPIRSVAVGDHRNWIIHILPYMDELNTYRHIDQAVGVYHANNAGVRAVQVPALTCPSDFGGPAQPPQSNYAAVHNDVEAPIDTTNNGVFFLNSHVRRDDITDGLAHTLFVGEKQSEPVDLGWMSGTSATLRNTGAGLNAAVRTPGMWYPPVPDSDAVPMDDDAAPADATAGDVATAEPKTDGETKPAEPAAEAATPDRATAENPPAAPPTAADTTNAAPTIATETATEVAAGNALAKPSGNPALRVGGFSSAHAAGTNFLFGDGSVRFIPETINLQILQQLAHRADGKLTPNAW